jgi:hypothetical protein
MSAPVVSQQLDAASYSTLVVEPALAVIRNYGVAAKVFAREFPEPQSRSCSKIRSSVHFISQRVFVFSQR